MVTSYDACRSLSAGTSVITSARYECAYAFNIFKLVFSVVSHMTDDQIGKYMVVIRELTNTTGYGICKHAYNMHNTRN